MSDKEMDKFVSLLQQGLNSAYEKMLREKAALGRSVAILDENGNAVEIPAQQVLDRLNN